MEIKHLMRVEQSYSPVCSTIMVVLIVTSAHPLGCLGAVKADLNCVIY